MSSRNVSYLRYCGSFLFLGVTGAVRDVLAKVEIVELSESLADVHEAGVRVSLQVCFSQRSRELSHLWRGDLSHTQQLVKNFIVDMDVTAEE